MVDFSATAGRIFGMITKPQETLAVNSQPVPPWLIVAKEHVLPIVIAAALINGTLLWLFQPFYDSLELTIPERGNPLLNILLQIVFQFAGIVIWATVVGFFARVLGGRNDFNAAYLLMALALTPHMVSAALQPIPVIGGLLLLASFIYSMVILYRGAPTLIGVPRESSTRHLVLSLVSMVMAGIAITLLLSPMLLPNTGPVG